MARVIGKLTAVEVAKRRAKGRLADGGGLYLQVAASGAKSWLFRFMLNGRARQMGLGPVHAVSLAEARIRAAECRRLRLDGVDPLEARRARRQQARLEAAKSITFAEAVAAYVRVHRAGWRNAKHAAQWESTLSTYAEPVIGKLSVQAVDTTLVLTVLEPIWATKPETASRLRGRIEAVLDWAKTRGYRAGENPARWRGHLENVLPKKSKIRAVKHHAALPYAALPEFMTRLCHEKGVAAQALQFTILTAARTCEIIGAQWDEIDEEAKTWTVPAERMKAGRAHRVPLSGEALAIVREAAKRRTNEDDGYVFPGARRGKPLSNMAMEKLLARMGYGDYTVHGFRSTFRDWAAERTRYPREVAEMALAHTIESKVEAAYRRGDLFEKRRRLMNAWANFCGTKLVRQRISARSKIGERTAAAQKQGTKNPRSEVTPAHERSSAV